MAVKENIEKIKSSLAGAAAAAGRKADEISLLPVSKRKPLESLLEAYEAGERVFGENRVDEALEKLSKLPDDAQIDLIGHLQSNKAAKTAGKFRLIHSVDSLRLSLKLNQANEKIDNVQDILIEVNTSGEDSKQGYRDKELMLNELEEILKLDHIRVRGFMTMAPFIEERDRIRRTFSLCREWRDEAVRRFPGESFPQLSMGMSGDFVEAIEEGSTMIRVGTAIFGARTY